MANFINIIDSAKGRHTVNPDQIVQVVTLTEDDHARIELSNGKEIFVERGGQSGGLVSKLMGTTHIRE